MHDRHLIADHLEWFKESTQDSKLRTIEELLKAKGEKVRMGTLDLDGTVEEYID
jgi:protein import protein ZIM17